MKARKTDPKKRRFSGLRDPDYAAYVRTLACSTLALAAASGGVHRCEGPIEATHIKSRGAGGKDAANLLPLCALSHRFQHQKGIKSWAESWSTSVDNLKLLAIKLWAQYQAGSVSRGAPHTNFQKRVNR